MSVCPRQAFPAFLQMKKGLAFKELAPFGITCKH